MECEQYSGFSEGRISIRHFNHLKKYDMKYITIIIAMFFGLYSFAQVNHLEVNQAAVDDFDTAIRGTITGNSLPSDYTIGVYGNSQTPFGVGVRGDSYTGVQGFGTFGLYGLGNTGVRGDQNDTLNVDQRAGLFIGNLEYTGDLIGMPSDSKLKVFMKNSESLLSKVENVKVERYRYKTGEFPQLKLSKRIQYGYVAQEIEALFPELVFQSRVHHIHNDGSISEDVTEYKTISYMGMIPILTQALQELSQKVDDQKVEIERLQDQIVELKGMK